ncbi:HotDog domain-containing protein [Xylariaceae sp. FL1019]|nr:HotDog domain-containing protein [Xylariaceae sp. FL1019]
MIRYKMHPFERIPWCAELLQKPGVVTFTPAARLPKSADGRYPSQDQLFKTTLKTSETVPNYIGFYQSPFENLEKTSLLPQDQSKPRLLVNSASLLIDLRPGINGFNATAHGGFIACLFDEIMGSLMFASGEEYRQAEARGITLPDNLLRFHDEIVFTVGMNFKLIKAIATPQVVIATAAFDRIEGRKLFLSYAIQDSEGTYLAKGEGIWAIVRKQKL